jgi:hypothetical protein
MASDLVLLALRNLPEVRGQLLTSGAMRLTIASGSMKPILRPGDEIAVQLSPIAHLRPGDLIVFQAGRELVCHRAVKLSADAVWARAEATSDPGEEVAAHRVLGRVAEIRTRSAWVGAKVILREALGPWLLLGLQRLQEFAAYRALVRPLVVRDLSFHVGLARGAVRYEWIELAGRNGIPALPPTGRPHVLVGKRRRTTVGWSVLAFRDSAWCCEELYVRLRYRGLGVESELDRLTRLLIEAR